MTKLINISSLFLLLPLIASEKCETQNRPFQSSTVKFTNELSTLVAEEADNFAVSPLSVWSLLHLVSKGAQNQTLITLKNKLLMPKECDSQLRRWLNIVYQQTDRVTVERGEIMIVDDSMRIKEAFRRDFTHSETAAIIAASSNHSATADIINANIARLTNGVINEVVTPDSLQDKPLILMDVMYFKSAWKTLFQKQYTLVQKFYDGNRKVIGKVNMMAMFYEFKTKYVEELNARVLEMPFAAKRLSMLIMVPKPGVTIKGLLESLKELSPEVYLNLGKKKEVAVQIPRFKIDFKIDLEKVLSTMGLSDVFSSEADFSGISGTPINVGGFSQRTILEVTERGAEAAVVSTAEFEDKMGPPSFYADSPFLYMIVDKHRKVPLIVGAYTKPSLY